MVPTRRFQDAPEVSRKRSEGCFGDLRVVMESYPSLERPLADEVTIYLARGDSQEFVALPWTVSWLHRIKLALRASTWPPKDALHIAEVTAEAVVAVYVEVGSMYDEWPVRTIRYSFAHERWSV